MFPARQKKQDLGGGKFDLEKYSVVDAYSIRVLRRNWRKHVDQSETFQTETILPPVIN
jgi:hypothetical protein